MHTRAGTDSGATTRIGSSCLSEDRTAIPMSSSWIWPGEGGGAARTLFAGKGFPQSEQQRYGDRHVSRCWVLFYPAQHDVIGLLDGEHKIDRQAKCRLPFLCQKILVVGNEAIHHATQDQLVQLAKLWPPISFNCG